MTFETWDQENNDNKDNDNEDNDNEDNDNEDNDNEDNNKEDNNNADNNNQHYDSENNGDWLQSQYLLIFLLSWQQDPNNYSDTVTRVLSTPELQRNPKYRF